MGGSIQYDPRMRRYYIDVYWEGKNHKIWFNPNTGEKFYDRRQAQKVLGRVQTEVDENTFHPRFWQPKSPLLIKNYFAEWLDSIDVSRKTRRDYKGQFENHIIPQIGGMDIRRIRLKHLTQLHRALSVSISEKTRYNVMGALKSMFRWAYQNEDIPRIPPFPKLVYQKPEIEYLTLQQQNDILNHISEYDRPIFEMAMEHGLRVGEVRAIQKDCVLDDVIVIKRTFSENDLREYTKTRSIRYCPITDYTTDILNHLPKHLSPFLFVRKDGKPYSNKNLNAIWKKACEKAGINIKLYNALRHSLGCQMLDEGFDMDLVREQLGHTRMDMTRRYAQRSVTVRKEALEKRRKVVPLRKNPDAPK